MATDGRLPREADFQGSADKAEPCKAGFLSDTGVENELPEPGIEEIDDSSAETEPRMRNPFADKLMTLSELLAKEVVEDFIVEGLFCRGNLLMLYGPPKTGKSFLAIDLALSIAAGLPWAGDRFGVQQPRRVVYASGEGNLAMKRRWAAAVEYLRVEVDLSDEVLNRIYFMPIVPQLYSSGAPGGSVQFTQTLQEQYPNTPFDLIIIDTLNRSTLGADENSAKDTSLLLQAVEDIKAKTGAAVLLIHHASKEGKARGSTTFLSQSDVLLSIKPQGQQRYALNCDFVKDAEPFPPVRYEIWPYDKSAVVRFTSGGENSGENAGDAQTHETHILEHMKACPDHWYTAKDLKEGLGISRPAGVYDAAKSLVGKKMIEESLKYPDRGASNQNPKAWRVLTK